MSEDETTATGPATTDIEVVADAVNWFLERSGIRPWDQYRDIDWTKLDPERLTEGHRSAVEFITFIEDHLPGYFALYEELMPVDGSVPVDEYIYNREYYHFTVKWAQEEDRHAHTLFAYQVRAGMATEAELRRRLAEEGRKRFEVPYRQPIQIFTYTLLQEKATQLFYQQLCQLVDEPVLRSLLTHLARDESRHFAFFSRLVEAHMRRNGPALAAPIREVLTSFKMPLATTLRNYWRWSLRLADVAGGYDHTEAYEELARIVQRAADGRTATYAEDLADLVRKIRHLP